MSVGVRERERDKRTRKNLYALGHFKRQHLG